MSAADDPYLALASARWQVPRYRRSEEADLVFYYAESVKPTSRVTNP
jgi:hypothetical protein